MYFSEKMRLDVRFSEKNKTTFPVNLRFKYKVSFSLQNNDVTIFSEKNFEIKTRMSSPTENTLN